MSIRSAIVWFRNDLRLRDNPALRHAHAEFDTILPVYIWSPEADQDAAPGGASRRWLHHSLHEFSARIERRGGKLVFQNGDPREILPRLARFVSADSVFWNRRYEPTLRALDSEVKTALTDAGLDARSFKANLLIEPWEVSTQDDRPFRVFASFWNSAQGLSDSKKPLPDVKKISLPAAVPKSVDLNELRLLPKSFCSNGIEKLWDPGELGARRRLREFLSGPIHDYHLARDFPAKDGVSRLSPYLHFGEISPRQIISRIRESRLEGAGAEAFVRELGWREFAHHVLFYFPHTVSEPLQKRFLSFRWRTDQKQLESWQQGRTGYPIVDAGMRQLLASGWMHNRVRMIVASFLTKDLLIHWREGASWFWNRLVDADLANNTLGWQWAGGCGADAAPYFRIFNPIRQGDRFDANGDYVRHWVPELAKLPAKWIHQPWEAPAEVLADAEIELGATYPFPIVSHASARKEALKRFNATK